MQSGKRVAILVVAILCGLALLFIVYRLVQEPAAPALAWSDRSENLWVGIPARLRFAMPPDRAAEGAALMDDAFNEIRRTGSTCNPFDPTSEVGLFNRENGRRTFAPSPLLTLLIRLSREAWNRTSGAFDVTVWPLKELWKRAVRDGVPPPPDDLALALARVGMQRLVQDQEGTIQPLDPPVSLDFGGIVKGFAVDRAAELLESRGALSGLIQVGGEVRAFGTSPERLPWRVGVRDPRSATGMLGVVTAATRIAISTSGNYEQPVRIAGRDYYHIFDPRTGQPVDTRLMGVTVVIEGGDWPNATADALATALAVLPPDEGLALIESLPGAGVLLLLRGEDGVMVQRVSRRMAQLYSHGPDLHRESEGKRSTGP
jgi:thiamine biosynthesis lipoprotein